MAFEPKHEFDLPIDNTIRVHDMLKVLIKVVETYSIGRAKTNAEKLIKLINSDVGQNCLLLKKDNRMQALNRLEDSLNISLFISLKCTREFVTKYQLHILCSDNIRNPLSEPLIQLATADTLNILNNDKLTVHEKAETIWDEVVRNIKMEEIVDESLAKDEFKRFLKEREDCAENLNDKEKRKDDIRKAFESALDKQRHTIVY